MGCLRTGLTVFDQMMGGGRCFDPPRILLGWVSKWRQSISEFHRGFNKSTHNKKECKHGLSVRTYFHTPPNPVNRSSIQHKSSRFFGFLTTFAVRRDKKANFNVSPPSGIINIFPLWIVLGSISEGQVR